MGDMAAAGGSRVGGRVVGGVVGAPVFGLADGGGRRGRRVGGMQRARLLGGAVAAVEEVGWSGVSVAGIASRARVSRKTFYDLFDDRDDCLLAVLDEIRACVVSELVAAGLDGCSWCERVRKGLWVVLSFFDREPELARLCVVGSARGSQRVLAWREDVFGCLVGVVDEGRLHSERASRAPSLTAEGVVGAVLTIVQRRLLEGGSVGGLLSELVSMIVLPYMGHAKAAGELQRSLPSEAAAGSGVGVSRPVVAYRASEDPLQGLPMRLTYRTARVLEAVAANPGVSNRLIGELAEIHDQGQVSKLLARLKRLGLLRNQGNGHSKGEANAWQLTALGEQITQQLILNDTSEQQQQQQDGRA